MNTKIKGMNNDDINDWILLSNQYDKYVLELVNNFDEWYNGNDIDISFINYMKAKITQREALVAFYDNEFVGAIAFSKTNNRITFFAISHQIDFDEVGHSLIKSALAQLNTKKPIKINVIKSGAEIIQYERNLLKEYGFSSICEGVENGVPVDVWQRL